MRPESIDSPVQREFSRLVCILSLQHVEEDKLERLDPPEEFLALGRFRGHFKAVHQGMPRFTEARTWGAARVETTRGLAATVLRAEARIGVVPHSGSALVLWLDLDLDQDEAIVALQETCFRREKLSIDGDGLLDAMKKSLADNVDAAFDQEVHQILAPSRTLLAELGETDTGSEAFDPDLLLRLVYREDEEFRPASSAICYPKELNRPAGSICAHGRGVTVLGGAAEHVENGIMLTALELVTAAGCLRRIRAQAVDALETASSKQDSEGRSPVKEQRGEVVILAGELRQLDLDLSFGVEGYLDNLRLPEIVLGAYRQSLAGVLELRAGAEATALMVERLQRVIGARQLELEAAEAVAAEVRRRSETVALGYVTLIALPVGASLAFLGANIEDVDEERSILALRYAPYYLIFLGIMLLGAVFYAAVRWWPRKG
jgi:hypothetical protein